MDVSSLSVSMAYASAMMAAAGLSSGRSQQLLRELELHGGPDARLDPQQFSMLYRALVVELDDEMLNFFSRPLRPGALKYTCLALLDAKNLQVALHRWSWMYRVLQDDLSLEFTTTTHTARFAIVPVPGSRPCDPFAVDVLLKLIHGVVSWLTGRRLPLVRVDFHFAQPAFAADHGLVYPGPICYGQDQSALVMDADLLQLPIGRTRPQLDEFLLRAPEDWMFARPRKTARLSLRLRDHLAEHLPRPVTAEGAADALAVSLRTLHRHLADEGTSFQRVKDEFRRDRAMQLLGTSDTPIATISDQLGFDSVASFHRAFRGWTGHTPGGFRSHGAGPP